MALLLTTIRLSWADIFNLLRRKKVALGSRGEIYAIAPGLIETRVVWNERPLFLWQGIGQKIEVRITNSQKALWNQTLSLADSRATYDGSALQPGRTKDWVLFNQLSQPTRFSFQFMAAKRRDRITADLMALSAQLQTKKATTETIALQRANYFAQHNLWSDVLQEVFSVKNPDAALTQFKQELLVQLCVPQNE